MKFNFKSHLNKIIIFTSIIILILIILINKDKIPCINVNNIIKFVSSKGRYAIIFFIAIYALKPFIIIIPATILTIVGGTLFGHFTGFLLSMIGFFLSGTLAFLLAKKLGRPFVEKIIKRNNVYLSDNIENNQFIIVFLLRFIPIFHYDILSYALGLSKIRYKNFILASMLGVTLETICYSYMGQNIFNPKSYRFIIPFIIILVISLIAVFLGKKRFVNCVRKYDNEK
ncbi:TVP38/TMEM64 family inner membrane protein YdjZ [Clostridium acetireducens DSM 10703]|jgi:uncharacterized membrane protein YdjX (TVP38/TMEM64 family)|uniref:TVP38/TMEM64 family membrane protein n=1 Tax=Clostridium acetireducens DSM 10703 TaxID=1121290 RepID=A0A1E8EX21_9CLOT|nr:TVP38/TMEM64 family protein [Clostridium acetireducens]OFI05312.1 TVP38/TMEM64 family inner membrane protein YdjZ [Clostridium acetireducens DSM 10703]